MRMKIKDLAKVMRSAPADRWVALSRDRKRILGSGKTVAAAVRQAQKTGESHPLIVKSPQRNSGIAATA